MRDLEKYQKDYNELPFEAHQELFRKKNIIESLEKYSTKNILEIGCGRDSIVNHYSDFKHLVIIEPANGFFEIIKNLTDDRNDVVAIHGFLDEKLDALKKYDFNFIILSSLLHELPNSLEMLNSIKTLCSEDTVIHINVPNAKSFHRILAFEMGLIPSVFTPSETQKNMQQNHTFDIDSLTILVNQAGLEIIETGTFFVKPFTHKQMEKLQQIDVITDTTLNGLYKMSKYFPGFGAEIYMNIRKGVTNG